MADNKPREVTINVTLFCGDCKQPLEIASSERNRTRSGAAVDGDYRLWVIPCTNCVVESEEIGSVFLTINQEPFHLEVEAEA